jgi:hypothetical protein
MTDEAAGPAAAETCPTCSTGPMSVADADLGDAMLVAIVLGNLQKRGTARDIQDLLARDPAGHADLTEPGNVGCLLTGLRKAGAHQQAAVLLARDPAGHADISRPGATAFLLNSLREAGAGQQVAALLARDPAGQCELDDRGMVVTLAWCLHDAGADDQVTTLLSRLSAAGDWSLLAEIGAATGLAVPQQDQAGHRGGERHARGQQQARAQAGQERGPVSEQRAEHGDR